MIGHRRALEAACKLLAAAALALLCLAAPDARAATCTLSDGSTVTVRDGSQTGVFGAGSGCTGGAGIWTAADLISCTNGVLNINGDHTFDTTVSNVISYRDGCRVNYQRDGTTPTNSIWLTVPPGGISSNSGTVSAWRSRGKYYEARSATPGLLDERDDENFFVAGYPVPCAFEFTSVVEPDCTAGDDTLWHLLYTPGFFNAAAGTPGEMFVEETIAQLDEDHVTTSEGYRSVLFFYNPDPTRFPVGPMDSNFWYWITEADGSPAAPWDPWISFDVRGCGSATGGDCNDPSYSLADRVIQEVELAADAPAGARSLSVASGFAAANEHRQGQVIYLQRDTEECGDDDAVACLPHPFGLRMLSVTDGTGANPDRIELLNPLPYAQSATCGGAACRAWVSPAAPELGAPIALVAPAGVRCATPTVTSCGIALNSNVYLQATWFDTTGAIVLSRSNVDGHFELERGEDIGFTDTHNTIFSSFRSSGLAQGTLAHFKRVMGTGTDDDAVAGNDDSCILNETPADGTGSPVQIIYDDSSCRYFSSHGFAFLQATGQAETRFTLNRPRVQFGGGSAGASYRMQAGGTIRDAESVYGAGSTVVTYSIAGRSRLIDGMAIIGSESVTATILSTDGTGTQDVTVRNLFARGLSVGGNGGAAFRLRTLTDCDMDGLIQTGTSRIFDPEDSASSTLTVARCDMRNFLTGGSSAIRIRTGAYQIRNSILWNWDTTDAGTSDVLLSVGSTHSAASAARSYFLGNVVGWDATYGRSTPGEGSQLRYIFQNAGTTLTGTRLGGNFLTGQRYRGSGDGRALHNWPVGAFAAVTWSRDQCFWNNEADANFTGSFSLITDLPDSARRDFPPLNGGRPVSPVGGFEYASMGDCGPERRPGLARYFQALGWNGITAGMVGLGSSGGGGGANGLDEWRGRVAAEAERATQ